jgi:Reverse transcriptase (RNA-dependent DNA polymerase).
MLRNILEEFYEFNLDLHLLIIDSEQAYDSLNRMYLYEILNEFQIPKKSVNLITMSWHDSNGKVKIQGHLAEAFETERGFR